MLRCQQWNVLDFAGMLWQHEASGLAPPSGHFLGAPKAGAEPEDPPPGELIQCVQVIITRISNGRLRLDYMGYFELTLSDLRASRLFKEGVADDLCLALAEMLVRKECRDGPHRRYRHVQSESSRLLKTLLHENLCSD